MTSPADYLVIAILHGVYLSGLYFLAKKLFNYTYTNSLRYTIFFGILMGLSLDLICVVLFRFWVYPIDNPLLYILVFIGLHIPAVPVCLAGMEIFLQRTAREVQNQLLPRNYYYAELAFYGLIFIGLTIWRISLNSTTAPEWFFPAMLVVIIFLSDGILGLFKQVGLVTLTLRGSSLAIFAPFVIGIIIGLFAESLNVRIPLYNNINTPALKVLGIPLFTLIGWGIAAQIYWTCHKIIKSNSISNFRKRVKFKYV